MSGMSLVDGTARSVHLARFSNVLKSTNRALGGTLCVVKHVWRLVYHLTNCVPPVSRLDGEDLQLPHRNALIYVSQRQEYCTTDAG